jgi:TonB family protein
MPRGWQLGDSSSRQFGSPILQARLTGERAIDPAPPGKSVASPVKATPKAAAAARPDFGALAPPLYLPANELDEKPLIRTRVEPAFPPDAPVSGGRVVLRVFIAETGNVDEVAVVSAQPEQVFDRAAARAFAGALFTPGRKNGAAVKSALTLEVLFGAPPPVALHKDAPGPLWQPPRRPRSTLLQRKESP